MPENRSELFKNIMIYLGILLILVGSTAARDLGLTFFGLLLLVIQTFEFKGQEAKKLVVAEIIIASSLSIVTIIQLIMSKSFHAPQVFMIVLLLGGILVTVEAVRKYADL
jgi:hypothetical protein